MKKQIRKIMSPKDSYGPPDSRSTYYQTKDYTWYTLYNDGYFAKAWIQDSLTFIPDGHYGYNVVYLDGTI